MKHWVFYTDRFIPKASAGCALGFAPIILIRPSKRDDIGLLEHEKKHCEQWYRHPIMHGLTYTFDDQYRLLCEVEAYREQLKYAPGKEGRFVDFIVFGYQLKTDVARVRWLLERAPDLADMNDRVIDMAMLWGGSMVALAIGSSMAFGGVTF
jgi:hypothetical protein